MGKSQYITIILALALAGGLYFFGKTTPPKKPVTAATTMPADSAEGEHLITIDTILNLAKKKLNPEQIVRITTLENSISRGAVKQQQMDVYKQLARFWYDSGRVFEPYAWYVAEAARLENSQKSLNFAARLFLDNLESDDVIDRKRWKALQAKDLFERSLMLNPKDDSATVGLGACYLFGDISPTPMTGILKIREVAERDTNNMYAQGMLAKAAVISGQYDKAIARFQTVCRHEPGNFEATLQLADLYDRMQNKSAAIEWYQRSLELVKLPEARSAIAQRIAELKK